MPVEVKDFEKFIVIGDKVLIKPRSGNERTKSGLYLPPTIQENEPIHEGYVIKAGPGYPIPAPVDDEPWKDPESEVKYIPLQAKEGDLAIYLQKQSFDIEINGEKYVLLPQAAILMLVRDETLFS